MQKEVNSQPEEVEVEEQSPKVEQEEHKSTKLKLASLLILPLR